MGLTDYLSTTKEEFNETLNSIKRQVNQCAPHALTLTKNIIRPRNEIDIDLSAKIFADCIESEEGKEGIKSFFEKRSLIGQLGVNMQFTDEHKALASNVKNFAQNEIKPFVEDWEKWSFSSA